MSPLLKAKLSKIKACPSLLEKLWNNPELEGTEKWQESSQWKLSCARKRLAELPAGVTRANKGKRGVLVLHTSCENLPREQAEHIRACSALAQGLLSPAVSCWQSVCSAAPKPSLHNHTVLSARFLTRALCSLPFKHSIRKFMEVLHNPELRS